MRRADEAAESGMAVEPANGLGDGIQVRAVGVELNRETTIVGPRDTAGKMSQSLDMHVDEGAVVDRHPGLAKGDRSPRGGNVFHRAVEGTVTVPAVGGLVIGMAGRAGDVVVGRDMHENFPRRRPERRTCPIRRTGSRSYIKKA